MKIDRTQLEEAGKLHTEPAPKQPKVPKNAKDPREWLSKNIGKVKIACLVLFLLSFVIGVRMIGTYRNLSADVAAQTKEIADLKKALGSEEETGETEETGTGEETGDTSQDRSKTDSERAGIFLSKLLNLSDYAAYQETRTTMAETYHLPADGNILSEFLPECSEEEFSQQMGGGMTFNSADSYTVSTDGEKISYFAVCSVTVTSGEGNSKTADRVCVFYTMDGEGNFTDVSAYSMSNS